MKKWVLLLLLANLGLFSWMRWGGLLTHESGVPALQAALNADKVVLMEPAVSSALPSSSAPGLSLTLSPLAPPAVAEKPQAEQTLTCAEWGEFSGADLARAGQALDAMHLGERLSQRIVEQDHGWWVYIPPQKNKAAVEKKLEQLKARGVEDYYVVQSEGVWLNAISLGVFKTEEAAKKYLTFLQGKVVRSARIGERSTRLKFTVFVLKSLQAAELEKLTAMQKGFPDSTFSAKACNI